MPKIVHFGEFLKTWSLRSNSVTRQVSFNRTKIGGKCQNAKIQMRHFGWFSNNVKHWFSALVAALPLVKPQVPLLEIVLLPHVISTLRLLAIDNAKLPSLLRKIWTLHHYLKNEASFGFYRISRSAPNFPPGTTLMQFPKSKMEFEEASKNKFERW